jgi:hypothetical protein
MVAHGTFLGLEAQILPFLFTSEVPSPIANKINAMWCLAQADKAPGLGTRHSLRGRVRLELRLIVLT